MSAMMISLSVTQVLAVTSSPDSDESTEDAKTQETIKERLKKVVDEKKDQIKGVTSNGQEKRGFVGTVKRVSEETLTVDTSKGTQILTITSDVVVLQDGKSFKVSNIEIDSQVVVIGYQKGEDFTARRILVLKKSLQPTKKSIEVGTIKKIDKQSVTITTRSDQNKIYSLSTKTVFEDNENTTIKLSDIDPDQAVLLMFVAEDSASQSIKDSAGKVIRFHLLSTSEASGTPTKETATPTPKVTVKPSATPKAKVTAKPTVTQ